MNSIKGNTIVWNQLKKFIPNKTYTQYGITFTVDSDGRCFVSGTCTQTEWGYTLLSNVSNSFATEVGHKYYLSSSNSKIKIHFSLYDSRQKGILNGFQSNGIPLDYTKDTVFNNEELKIVCIDLTQMFGAGNEPATVEEFEKMFPSDYYPYNEGQLISLAPTAVVSTGVGLHSEADLSWIQTLTYTPEGSTEPELLFPDGLCRAGTVYDEVTPTKAIKRIWKYIIKGNEDWKMPTPQYYIKSDATNMFLDFSTSSNNFKYYTRNILNERLKFSKKEIWLYVGDPNTITTNGAADLTTTQVHCNIANSLLGITDYTQETQATATQKFKAYLQNQYNNGTPLVIYYELATPIEVELSPSKTIGYAVQPGGTEQLLPENLPSTTPSTAEIIMDVTYPLNAVGTIQNLPHNYMNERTLDTLISALNTAVPTHTFAKTTVNGYLQITTTANPTTE